MATVIALWTVAMIAGMRASRWITGILSAVAVIAAAAAPSHLGGGSSGWLLLAVCAGGPWLLAAAKARDEAEVRAFQQEEAARKIRLSEASERLLVLQRDVQSIEARLSRMGDIYRVTKETGRAMRVEELLTASLESAAHLLDASALRLVDASQDPPQAHRAARSADGRLAASGSAVPLSTEGAALERAVWRHVAAHPFAGVGAEDLLGHALPPGVTSVAWAPLKQEQQPAGVLIADDLPPAQVGLLSTIANQLSLQLARIHLYQQVEALAVTDALTGLSVRGYLLQRAREELERSRRHRLPCTLLMVDLDFFKQKNDTYGHLVGDVVLQEVAHLLQRNLRDVDLIGRYGGEEMILLLIETTPDQALPIAQRLKQLVELHPIRAYDELLTQTVSIGLAGCPEDGQTLETLIERADQALYAAKHAGRNRVVRWSPALATASERAVDSAGETV